MRRKTKSIYLKGPWFPGARKLLDRDHELRDLSARTQRQRKLRRQGQTRLPHLAVTPESAESFWLLREMREAERRENPAPILKAIRAHTAAIAGVRPVVEVARWGRWLYLEHALELGSRIGSFVFAAVVVRTMIEELGVLVTLDRMERRLAENRDLGDPTQLEHARTYEDLLLARILPRVRDDGLPHEHAVQGALVEALRPHFTVLNDYVHPNYGSHILALFPERSEGPRVVLSAMEAVYNTFFELSWSKRTLSGRSQALPPLEVHGDARAMHELLDRRVPELLAEADRLGIAPPPELRESFESRTRESARPVEESLCQLPLSSFAPLLEAFGVPCEATLAVVSQYAERHPELGLSPHSPDLIMFEGARRTAQRLETVLAGDVPAELREDNRQVAANWCLFVATAAELAIEVTQHKEASLRRALVHAINNRSPLAAALALRSIIEHYGLAVHLNERLHRGWLKVEKRGRAGKLPTKELIELERRLATVLGGTRQTTESSTTWKARWARAEVDRHVNVMSAVKEGCARIPILQTLYDMSSNVLHGKGSRGVDLLPPTAERFVERHAINSLGTLMNLSTIDTQLDALAPATLVIRRFAALARVLRDDAIPVQNALRYISLPEAKLKRGRDYFGAGTETDPYRFRAGLIYHEAFGRLCDQLGLDSDTRRLRHGSNGPFDVVRSEDEEEVFFAVNLRLDCFRESPD